MEPINTEPRIALFLPSLEIGGVERVILNLAEGFVKKGISVDLVLAHARGEYMRRIPPEVRLVELRASRVAASLIPLVRYLQKTRPWGLISAKEYANVIAIGAKLLSRIPTRIVVTVHTTLSKHVHYGKGIRERFIVPTLARWLYRYADGVVAVAHGVADDLSQFLGLSRDGIRVVYNPVLADNLFAVAQQPVAHPWFAPGEPPVILSVGRLTVAKDYPTLITAFAKVRQRCEARLVILGEGEERERLQALVQELGLKKDVWLPGSVEPPYPYVAHASVFVLSSIWEGLPTAMIEALALGVPVVSTDCPGGIREVLDGGRYGLLVPVGNADALADAIVCTLKAPPDSVKLKERARYFSVDRAVAGYLDVLNISKRCGREL